MSGIQQLQEEYNMGFGAEESNSLLDNPDLAAAMKKMLELQLQVMVIPIVKRIVGPMMENMVRTVVKEELERAQERFLTREKWKSGDEGHVTQVRQLELLFSEQVSERVYTGKEIKGEGGDHLVVALVDPLSGSHVFSGPEASAKIELIVLNKDDDDAEDNGRPILSRNHIKLKDGIAVLDKIKFKHKSKWTKSCKVTLVARANLNGMTVKEAATEPFLVVDCRSNLYKKRYPPSLLDNVWRLNGISRGSKLHKRLMNAKINTVVEFLRLLNMDPHRLKQILKVSAEKFKVIVEHAKTCLIGENLYLYNSTSSERETCAVFNDVGCLQGLLYDDKYVSIDMLSEDEKVDAHKIMESAFLDLGNAKPIENEASIAHLLSQTSSANGVNTSSSPRTEDADGRNFSHTNLVPAFEDVQSIESETSIPHLPSGSSNANGANTSNSPRTENASCSDLFPQIVVPMFENVEPIENEASATNLAIGSSKANGAKFLSSPRTENAAGSNFYPEILVPPLEDVELIENETSINHLASGSPDANDASNLTASRTDNISDSNFCIWKPESDYALPSTVPRHLTRIFSFGRDPFNAFDLVPANNMDSSSYRTDSPIYSRSASEDFAEQFRLLIEHSDQRTTAGDKQMTGTHTPSSSMARQRWRMAIRILAPGDMQARKMQRLK